MASVFWPQNEEHGCGLRKPAGGAGSWPGCAALVVGAEAPLVSDVVAMFSLTPMTPETSPAIEEGIDSGLFARRTFLPFTW